MNPKTIMALLAVFTSSAWADLTVTSSQTDNAVIPDYVQGNLNAISENITLNNSGIQSITGVQVTLNVAAGGNGTPWNGDYYAYLTDPSGGISILLNRVGTTDASNPNDFGYGDAGFDITLGVSGYDIHNYQDTSYSLNSDGQLTGDWAADGRTTSPFGVQASDPRTALLSALAGTAADGTWTLVIADASSGNFGVLDSWGLSVTGTPASQPLPDNSAPWTLPLLSGLGMIFFAGRFAQLRPVRVPVGAFDKRG